jgi:hypothetical protein
MTWETVRRRSLNCIKLNIGKFDEGNIGNNGQGNHEPRLLTALT